MNARSNGNGQRTTAQIIKAISDRIELIDKAADTARKLNEQNRDDLAALFGLAASPSGDVDRRLRLPDEPAQQPVKKERKQIDWRRLEPKLIELMRLGITGHKATRGLGLHNSKNAAVQQKITWLSGRDPELKTAFESAKATRREAGEVTHERQQVMAPKKWEPILEEAIGMALEGRTEFEIAEHFNRRVTTVDSPVSKAMKKRGLHDELAIWRELNAEERAARKRGEA